MNDSTGNKQKGVRLKSVSITGIRGVGSEPIEFSCGSDVTILTGANGLGKSSIVAGIQLSLTNQLRRNGVDLKEKEIRSNEINNDESVSAALEFLDLESEIVRSVWESNNSNEHKWQAEELCKLCYDERVDPAVISNRFLLTHFLPQTWGDQFHHLKQGDRQRMLLEQVRVSDLSLGLDSLKSNRRVGRAIIQLKDKLISSKEAAENRLTSWTRSVNRWNEQKQQLAPLEMSSREGLVSSLQELAKSYNIDSQSEDIRLLCQELNNVISSEKLEIHQSLDKLNDAHLVAQDWEEQVESHSNNSKELGEFNATKGQILDELSKLESLLIRDAKDAAEAFRLAQEQVEQCEYKEKVATQALEKLREANDELTGILSQLRQRHIHINNESFEVCPVCDSEFEIGILEGKISGKLAHNLDSSLSEAESYLKICVSENRAAQNRKIECETRLDRIDSEILTLQWLVGPFSETESISTTKLNDLVSSPRLAEYPIESYITQLRKLREQIKVCHSIIEKQHKVISIALDVWRKADLPDSPTPSVSEAELASANKRNNRVNQDHQEFERIVSELEKFKSHEALDALWKQLVDDASKLGVITDNRDSGRLETPVFDDQTWLSQVSEVLSELFKQAANNLNEFETQYDRLKIITTEVGSNVDALDKMLIEAIAPIVDDFLLALVPDLFGRVAFRHLKSGPQIETRSSPVNMILSEGEQRALSIAILLAMHVRFDWCRWRGLILDDLFQSTDVVRVAALLDVLAGLSSHHKSQLIITTHDFNRADWTARRMMKSGLDVARYNLVQTSSGGVEAQKVVFE
ncbi:hypothetical protein EA187_14345 [Lujinxingia sediminis]|uniref:RecF/RecN/SMC N-terminal domain-containing protein n=1 Tax=Lujinxingia sediminis TaxID=2480984 RepID=A0ABY0CR80_9DELT|nr:AAA family ATPase [Lujinxingia sediminis]RVU43011.1 hypothetical protein EA187_14345 [Lujinxingia sediminis]